MRSSGFLALLLLGGCSTTLDLYPVQGPLSLQRPLPTAKGVADGIAGNSGKLTITLANGQVCVGRWSSVAPQYAGVTTGSLFNTYGAIAGFSSVASGIVPGINRGQAFASCPDGNTIEAEFFTGSGTADGYGVAKDGEGNVYKMLF